jgi:hypothetical protein
MGFDYEADHIGASVLVEECVVQHIIRDSPTSYGFFSTAYTSASSNLRETTAVLTALLYFRQALQENGVHQLAIRSDNRVTVFNLQRQGVFRLKRR